MKLLSCFGNLSFFNNGAVLQKQHSNMVMNLLMDFHVPFGNDRESILQRSKRKICSPSRYDLFFLSMPMISSISLDFIDISRSLNKSFELETSQLTITIFSFGFICSSRFTHDLIKGKHANLKDLN